MPAVGRQVGRVPGKGPETEFGWATARGYPIRATCRKCLTCRGFGVLKAPRLATTLPGMSSGHQALHLVRLDCVGGHEYAPSCARRRVALRIGNGESVTVQGRTWCTVPRAGCITWAPLLRRSVAGQIPE